MKTYTLWKIFSVEGKLHYFSLLADGYDIDMSKYFYISSDLWRWMYSDILEYSVSFVTNILSSQIPLESPSPQFPAFETKL